MVFETVCDVVASNITEPLGSLTHNSLEHHMLPPSSWPQDNLVDMCNTFIHLLEVYVNDCCTLVQKISMDELHYISQTLFHAICIVFQPPHITGHDGGDSM